MFITGWLLHCAVGIAEKCSDSAWRLHDTEFLNCHHQKKAGLPRYNSTPQIPMEFNRATVLENVFGPIGKKVTLKATHLYNFINPKPPLPRGAILIIQQLFENWYTESTELWPHSNGAYELKPTHEERRKRCVVPRAMCVHFILLPVSSVRTTVHRSREVTFLHYCWLAHHCRIYKADLLDGNNHLVNAYISGIGASRFIYSSLVSNFHDGARRSSLFT